MYTVHFHFGCFSFIISSNLNEKFTNRMATTWKAYNGFVWKSTMENSHHFEWTIDGAINVIIASIKQTFSACELMTYSFIVNVFVASFSWLCQMEKKKKETNEANFFSSFRRIFNNFVTIYPFISYSFLICPHFYLINLFSLLFLFITVQIHMLMATNWQYG